MLSVYTRHYAPCIHKDSRVRDCSCPKWVRGILPEYGRLRQSARTRDWQQAEERARQLEQPGAFEIATLDQAVKMYSTSKQRDSCRAPR